MNAEEEELAVLSVDHLFLVLMHIDLRILKQTHGAGMVRIGMGQKNRSHLVRLNPQPVHLRFKIFFAHTGINHHVTLACFKEISIHELVFHDKHRIVKLLCFSR